MCTLPYIAADANGVPILHVDGAPYLMIGAELHNSASSSLEWMEKEVWPYIRPFGLNTVILPAYWECVEPEEGVFDFDLIRGVIRQAIRERVKIVLLWFGLWKNGESMYVPRWVKADMKRFPREYYENGLPSDTVTPLSAEAVEADKKAFTRLMTFLKEEDTEHTVVMVQVENEIGFLGSERDFGPLAEAAYEKPVPADLPEAFRPEGRTGSWEAVYGEDAPEMFMAYHYAKAVETIASAGRAVLPLPMYVNNWLEQHPDRPGIYPSGGPVMKLVPFWRAMCPSLDLVAPDIYVADFKGTCEGFKVGGNPLFIPEARRDPMTASNIFYAFGGLDALGFSPFAAEDFLRDDLQAPDPELLKTLNIASTGFLAAGTAPFFKRSCEVINNLCPFLLKYRGTDRMKGFIQASPYILGETLSLPDFDLQIDYQAKGKDEPGAAGLIILTEKGFYIAGTNFRFTVLPKKASRKHVTLVTMEEGHFEGETWTRGRILNGDEKYQTGIGSFAEIRYIEAVIE